MLLVTTSDACLWLLLMIGKLTLYLFNIHRMLQVPKDMTWEINRYQDHTLHMINTDIDKALDIDDARREAEQKAANSAAASGGGEEPPPSDSGPAAAAAAPSSDTPGGMDVDRDDAAPAKPLGRFHALCLHFTLPTAAYATMCLREITRQDTSTIFHTSLNMLAAGQHPTHSAAQAAAGGGDSAGGSSLGGEEEGGEGGAGSATAAASGVTKGAVIRVGTSISR